MIYRWLSPGTLVSSTNKLDRHDITKILLKVALTTIKQTNKRKTLQLQRRCFDLSCISKERICDTISDCIGAYREDEKDKCTLSQTLSSCEELWNVGHRSNGTYTIRVGSYGNEIRELILNV
jgi:hypothetical protein